MSNPQPPASIAYHSPEKILAHPGFVDARNAFVDAVLELYEGDLFLIRLLLEAARTVVFGVIVSLDAQYDEADRATWPTMALLKQQMTHFGLSSSRRIEDLAARLIHSDFLETAPSKLDGRVRLLKPTAKMLETDQGWLAVNYLPLHMMFPDPGYLEPVQRDPIFQRVQRQVAMGFMSHGAQILAGNPDIMLFLGRDAGTMVLMKLIQMTTRADADAPSGLSYADIGARYGVSRTHVRALLQDAEQAGLVSLTGRGGRLVELKPAVWRAFDRFVAEAMSGHDLLYKIAKGQMAAVGPREDANA